jgi:TetR/AcrR family transcriptional repressor of nem operon
VKSEIKRFFELNINWLQQRYIEEKGMTAASAKAKAIQLLASLEGMMILVKVLEDKTAFDNIQDYL